MFVTHGHLVWYRRASATRLGILVFHLLPLPWWTTNRRWLSLLLVYGSIVGRLGVWRGKWLKGLGKLFLRSCDRV